MDRSGDEGLRALAVHLAGPAEIAEALGIKANTVNVWKVRHSDFPAPVRKLRTGEIWDMREVVEWATRTERLPAQETSRVDDD